MGFANFYFNGLWPPTSSWALLGRNQDRVPSMTSCACVTTIKAASLWGRLQFYFSKELKVMVGWGWGRREKVEGTWDFPWASLFGGRGAGGQEESHHQHPGALQECCHKRRLHSVYTGDHSFALVEAESSNVPSKILCLLSRYCPMSHFIYSSAFLTSLPPLRSPAPAPAVCKTALANLTPGIQTPKPSEDAHPYPL